MHDVRFIMNNSPNCNCGNIVSLGKCALGFTINETYFVSLCVRKFCALLSLALKPVPAFGNHVLRILLKGALEKMIWVGAWRIVALVQYIQRRYLPSVNYPTEPVRRNKFCFPFYLSGEKFSISPAVSCASPKPASSSLNIQVWKFAVFVDLCPESFYNGWREALIFKKLRSNVFVHNVSLFDVLPRSRMFVHRAGISIFTQGMELVNA